MQATKQQVKAINAILATRGLMDGKKELVHQFTGGRTERSSELTQGEAVELLQALNKGVAPTLEELEIGRMSRKVIAIAFATGMVKWVTAIGNDGTVGKRMERSHLDAWLLKYGYLHKPLREYEHDELPALITQMEKMEKDYLQKL